MTLKAQNKHKKLLAWTVLVKRWQTLNRAIKDPHYWITAQNKEIRGFVEYIYQIPFYRKRFDEAGVKPDDIKVREDFKKLPPLTKEEYRAWILEETKDKSKFQYWMHRQTTGSSGTPLDLYSLPIDRAAEIANLSRCALIQQRGFNPFFSRLFSTMTPRVVGGGGTPWYSFPFAAKMSSVAEPKDLVEAYNIARPDFYHGNKTAVLAIAQYALEHNISLHKAKCVASISEPLYDNDRATMTKAYGDCVFDIYGCAETGNFAVDTPRTPGKHTIWNDTHVVNLYNQEKVDGKEDVFTGQLMLTSLIHRGFPLVNYLVGDTIELTIENEVPYITKILGRTNDVIKNADGSTFKWMHINRIMFGLTEISQFRVIQTTLQDVKFVFASSVCDERKKEIEDTIMTKAKDFFGDNMSTTGKYIHFEWVYRIPPDPNGKVRILISQI